MREIISGLRSRWDDLLTFGGTLAPSLTGGGSRNGRSVDLYECSSCRSVLIEPPSESCSQCASGTLEKV